MAENYKHLYEQMKKMLSMYQDEIVPGMREQLENRVEVVRCKNCAYWRDRGLGQGTCDRETEEMGLSRLYRESDFCSYGERRKDV